MRGYRTIVLALASSVLLQACGGQGGQGAFAHPEGWQQRGKVWTDPRNPREQYATVSNENAAGLSLSDLASQVTTDTLLAHKGAKFVRADRFPPCPGEAGLQTFMMRVRNGTDVLRVAFTQWNGPSVIASYERPISVPDNPAAVLAMTRAVCSAVSGAPTLPPATR